MTSEIDEAFYRWYDAAKKNKKKTCTFLLLFVIRKNMLHVDRSPLPFFITYIFVDSQIQTRDNQQSPL